MNILQFLVGLFTGKAGETVGGAVSTAAQIAAVIAAVTPIGLWLTNNKDAVFIVLTYGDLAFWGVLGLGQFLIIRLVHRAPPPGGHA